MGQLQRRLTNEQISAIVSDVHKDSHVLEILSLVKKGIKSSAKRRFLNWTNFKERLTKAMTEFQKDFLPHMKHEEEVITSPFPTPPATSVRTHTHTHTHTHIHTYTHTHTHTHTWKREKYDNSVSIICLQL